ncbi:uncharacterized protein LOC112088411 [Eutrema salsugineum]|uniref:uncharacterized protein LOC112088411 n=1 Tax=Eutrema salsugineum TaxID=72664 RepID=UPI000CED0D1D|nr:uncharacterized protein LOC112088411 [Eutrema salsugineum]
MFRKLLRLRKKALSFLSIVIGNGEDSFFWCDPLTLFGSLIVYLGPNGPSRLGVPIDALVSDLITSEGWNLPPAKMESQMDLYAYISQISPSSSSDRAVWKIDGKAQISFSSKRVWNSIRPQNQEVAWFSSVWHKAAIPKHAITTWLFSLNRNPTVDRLFSWGLDVDTTCLLCGLQDESRDHLFFECSFSAEIWNLVTSYLHLNMVPTTWSPSLVWIGTVASPKALSCSETGMAGDNL